MLVAVPLVAALVGGPAAAPPRPVYDVPRLTATASDGAVADWGEQGFLVAMLASDAAAPSPSPTVRLGWDDRGLLAFVSVTDATPAEAPRDDALGEGDSVELFLNTGPGGSDQVQVIVAPGRDPQHARPRHSLADQRRTADLKATPLAATVTAWGTAEGYGVEVLLPWAVLGLQPARGLEVGCQILVRDRDAAGRTATRFWFPVLGTPTDTSRSHRLRLADRPSRPVRLAATGRYEHFRRTVVRVLAPAELAGREVALRDGRRRLATATLAAQGEGAGTTVVLPMPPPGRPYAALAAVVEGEQPAWVCLPDADALRRQEFERAPLVFKPFVFTGTSFPPCDFEQPNLVEDLVGPYTIRTTFYDAQYRPVVVAGQPGRYGAVVEVTTADGRSLKRYCTLYRHPQRITWWSERLTGTISLPAGLGIAPGAVVEQATDVAELLKRLVANGLSREPDLPVLLAGLAEAPVGAGYAGPFTADARWWYRLRKALGDLTPYPYLVHLPREYEADAGRQWPLLLFLHGSGERGGELQRARIHGPLKMAAQGRELPFVLVAPHCPVGEPWSPWLVRDLVEELCGKYRIDRSRLLLTGLSMGGSGTWSTALEFPDLFAAAAPVCGRSTPAAAARIRDLPVWVFHGARDQTVPIAESEAMVAALQQAGSDVKFTVYPEAGHDSWSQAYASEELYAWLLEQRREP